MSFLADKDETQQEEPAEARQRWSDVLDQEVRESRTGRPWWQNALVFLAWAAGIATVTAIAVAVLLGIVDLFSSAQMFSKRTLSDWLFYAMFVLTIFGLIAPSAGDVEGVAKKIDRRESQRTQRRRQTYRARQAEKARQKEQAREDKATRAARRRIRRVYDPWRWRFWGAAAFTFLYSMLIGSVL